MFLNCGTTNRSIAVRIRLTSATTATGYVMAALILPRSLTSVSIMSDSRSRTLSSDPPVSPDFTIET